MKSTQFVCKESAEMNNLDAIEVPAARYSDSYGHGDRESVFQRFGSFFEGKESFYKAGYNELELNEITGLMSPTTSSKTPKICINIPKVDIGTFMPLLGTKFFCFHPCNFATVSEEINSYLNCLNASVNYDLDEVNHVWKCQENVDFESAVFTIALYEDSVKDKIFVKFHRLSGSAGVFSASVERFCRMACLSSELKAVNPEDLSETRVTHDSIKEGSKKKRMGAFKALPLPLTLLQKSITCSEFISYCEIFNLWSHSDIPECLASLLSSMPKMWKDLMSFYEAVEKKPSSESMGELVAMFASINRIYKNLCAIAVQSHNSMMSGVATTASNLALTSLNIEYNSVNHPAVMIEDHTAAADYMGHSHDPHSYDYLDFDEVDTSAGYADDHMYGAHAAGNNQAHRSRVTMDVTKSHYRSMTVFEEAHNESRFTSLQVDTSKGVVLATAAAPTHEVHLNVKGGKAAATNNNNESMYNKFLSGGSSPAAATGNTTSESTPEVFQFAELLSQQSKEDLSSILYLSMACICEQFDCRTHSEDVETDSFDLMHYLTRLLKSNQEFTSVLQEIAHEEFDTRVPINSFGSYRSKDIKMYANQLNSLL